MSGHAKTIVVGVDGEQGGQDAYALAQMLANRGARMILVHAFPFDPLPSEGAIAAVEATMRRASGELLSDVAAADDVERVSIGDNSPARALHRVAIAERADLIVIGSCHRGAVGRVLLGDTSRSTLHGAPCAVAVAPRGYAAASHPVHVVGVGFDASRESSLALGLAASIARAREAGLRLRFAVTPPSSLFPSYADMIDYAAIVDVQRERAQQKLDEVIGSLNVAAIGEVVVDTPGDALVRLSEEVDMIVAGSRGWGAARRVVLGSTTDRLVRHSHCPVLVVPGPTEQHDEPLASATQGAAA